MKNKAYDLASYNFSKDEAVLLDANVWLYLYPAPSDATPCFATSYSLALKNMRTVGVHLAMDALILSEYLNRYCRIEFNAQKKQGETFKQFRNSPGFALVGKTSVVYANRILNICKRYDHPFATSNISQVLTDVERGTCDFNDGLLAETCRKNGWKLVTNDGDFTEGGIEIITSNKKLLAACK